MSKIKLLLIILAATASAFAQNYPLPASVNEPQAICTNCTGMNYSGQSNNGLPTYSYDAPLDFTGRFLDSSSTGNVQNAGMRTIRARTVRTVPSRNRLYIQGGETVFAYALDTFFTTRLAEPMIPLNQLAVTPMFGFSGRGGVYEKLSRPDAFFYPEDRASGWTCGLFDVQRTLYDYDLDDRGYLYASTIFGWGIQHDDGRTDGTHMPFVYQDTASSSYFNLLFAIQAGSKYYVVASQTGPSRIRIYDVTNPAAPIDLGVRGNVHIRAFAKDDIAQRLVIADSASKLSVHSYAGFIAGAAPLAEHTAAVNNAFIDVSFDDNGNVWAVESLSSGAPGAMNLWKLAGGSLTKSVYDRGSYAGMKLHASAGYLAVVGKASDGGYGVRLFDVRALAPSELAIDDFFRKYYFRSPSGYAQPYLYWEPAGVRIMKQGAKTYLMNSAGALGDVYEIPTFATSITGLSPVSGSVAGGTAVIISGLNLEGTPDVTFGGVDAASITVTNGRIVAVTPPGSLGAVDVVVSYPGSAPLTVPQQFTYVPLAAPQNFTATGSGASVNLAWSALEGTVTYELERRVGSTWELLSSQAGTGYTDGGVSSAQTYAYRLRAIAGTSASPYAYDVATTVPLATGNIAAGMPIRASHIADVQNGVNALRAAAGLSAVSFPPVSAGQTVLASHLTAPRTAATEARTALGIPTSFTDATPSLIRAIHVQELLDAVR